MVPQSTASTVLFSRIFRDFGRIPGLDIAFVKDGYIYHTEYDTSRRIPLGSIQRAGDNVLSVLSRSDREISFLNSHFLFLRLARFKYLGNVDEISDKVGSAVYFDLLGFKMISYPAWLGVLITFLMFFINCYFIIIDFNRTSKKLDITMKDCVTILALIILSLVLCLIVSICVSLLVSLLLSKLGVTMSWYSRPYLLFLLYSLPSLNSVLIVIHRTKLCLNTQFSLSSAPTLEMFSLHSSNSIFTIISLGLTLLGLRSAFIFSNGLMFPALWWGTTWITGQSRSSWSSFLLLTVLMVVPVTMWSYIIQLIFTIFIPIMGRRGPSGNPDLILGLATSTFTVLMCLLVLPVLYSLRRQVWVRWSLTVLHLLTLLLVTTSSLGFPYSGDPGWPTPKRVTALHVSRVLEDGAGEGGGLVCSHDHQPLPLTVSRGALEVNQQCEGRLTCGVPTTSIRNLKTDGCVWLPSPPPVHHTNTSLQVVSRERISEELVNITLAVTGPSRVMVLVSGRGDVSLESWSLSSGMTSGLGWGSRPVYQVQQVRGLSATDSDLAVWVVVRVGQGTGEVVVTVSGHYYHGPEKMSSWLTEWLASQPKHLTFSAWTVQHKYYSLGLQ